MKSSGIPSIRRHRWRFAANRAEHAGDQTHPGETPFKSRPQRHRQRLHNDRVPSGRRMVAVGFNPRIGTCDAMRRVATAQGPKAFRSSPPFKRSLRDAWKLRNAFRGLKPTANIICRYATIPGCRIYGCREHWRKFAVIRAKHADDQTHPSKAPHQPQRRPHNNRVPSGRRMLAGFNPRTATHNNRVPSGRRMLAVGFNPRTATHNNRVLSGRRMVAVGLNPRIGGPDPNASRSDRLTWRGPADA